MKLDTMWQSEWRDIKGKSDKLHSLAESGSWPEFSLLMSSFDQDIRSFFETTLPDLSVDDQIKVKAEGEHVLFGLQKLMKKAAQSKASLTQEAAGFLHKKKGVAAYKKV